MRVRKVCFVTGSRADYGLLRPVMQKVKQDSRFQMSLVVMGSHLDMSAEKSVNRIVEDGFTIDRKVECNSADRSLSSMAVGAAKAAIGFVEALESLRPDLVVVLGDRFEILGATQAAFFLRIPVAHLHGGELSEGCVDDNVRHAMTKFSQIHLVAHPEYRKRVIQLGENPERVYVVGAPGLDTIREASAVSNAEMKTRFGTDFPEKFVVVTYHPETMSADFGVEGLRNLLSTLQELDTFALFTGVNADAGGDRLSAMIQEYCRGRPARARFVANLGSPFYARVLRAALAVVGNSSSGIIEAPFLGVPTVNIGSRQKGRLRASTVMDCDSSVESIRKGLLAALEAKANSPLRQSQTIFGDGFAAEKIVKVLAEVNTDQLKDKTFFDIQGPWIKL